MNSVTAMQQQSMAPPQPEGRQLRKKAAKGKGKAEPPANVPIFLRVRFCVSAYSADSLVAAAAAADEHRAIMYSIAAALLLC